MKPNSVSFTLPALRAFRTILCAGAISWLGMGNATAIQTNSSPIAISNDDRFVWSVNPDNNSVSVFDVFNDANVRVAEIPVGREPRRLAITPSGSHVFVTNMAGNSVSVIDTATRTVIKTIGTASDPFGCVVSLDGSRVYVAEHSSDTVAVIDVAQLRVVKTIAGVGPKPAGLAIAGDKLYVTQFLALLRPGGVEGADNGKEGRVSVISQASQSVVGTVILNPLANSGFNSNGSVLDRIAPTNPATFTFATGCFPNLLESIVIRGTKAYLPNVGSSPNGPVRFNVNVQALVSVFDTTADAEFGQALNMNRGVQFEPLGQRLFNTTPIAIAFKRNTAEGFAVAAGIDRLVRVSLEASGAPTINAPTAPVTGASPIVRVQVGRNPQGIVLNSTDTRAYVFNFISRDVSVVNIDAGSAANLTQIARIPSAALPPAGTLDAKIHLGKSLFNTSIGPAGTNENALPPAGRMSDLGWGNCYNCHPRGLTDGVTWMFGDGPRQTVSMESTGEHPQPAASLINANGAPVLPDFKQRVLNWSAVRDEIQDFELNIRGVSGGQGLIRDGLAVVNLTPTANTGRDADLDALAAYTAIGIRAPLAQKFNITPLPVRQGRQLFASANCQGCHGGPNWTRSRVDFTPPPLAEPITAGQLTRFLFNVGTFDSTAFNEVRPNGAVFAAANGALGINTPSLVSVFAGAPYFHGGAAPTLGSVLENVTHRSAGTGGVDTLTSAADRALLVRFLQTIDTSTPIFP